METPAAASAFAPATTRASATTPASAPPPAAAPADPSPAAATSTAAPSDPGVLRSDVRLDDSLWADSGVVFMSGTQALVRLLLMQRRLDAARGLATQGFVSGYRGSPLGGLDSAIWKAGPRFTEAGIRFVPAVNEELAATQVLGTQRVESDPQRTVDAVFALWYGKGPGVDRAGDALKHGHAYGASPHGGVLVVAGDDHGCVSSSMPHQSDPAMMAWGMPVLQPADVVECLEFGLYGWALSRYSGAWVGLAALSEVVESAGTVDLDEVQARVAAWGGAAAVRAATGHVPPPDGLHYRWPDLPSLRIESRLADKLQAVAAFARINRIDRLVIDSPRARLGIVTCGKAHHDLMEVFRRLRLSPQRLAEAGLRLYKVGLAFPLQAPPLEAFAQGLEEVLVVEEKGAVVETQLRSHFYNAPAGRRPVIVGKHDADGAPLVSALGELRPSRLIELVSRWLARHVPAASVLGDHAALVRDFTPPPLLSNEADAVRRLPYFCAGCPHNTSTRVPEGSTARAGIGCHFMANWMDRQTEGLIQMGGEGVDWVSHAQFTRQPHVFQNLGDGTYFHSGVLAIRQAVAAGANITYKILYNDAVAMTGGQPVDGATGVDAIARQLESEGVRGIVVLSDDIGKYRGQRARFPAGTAFHDRGELDAVQRRLRERPGVTALIYEQTCAAEKRRRRRKGAAAGRATAPGATPVEPPRVPVAVERRLFIHDAVCEGCGDCSVQSNCVALLPLPTPQGRKRRIDQSSCNLDGRCVEGFCPSFVTVTGGRLRRRPGVLGSGEAAFQARVAQLPLSPAHAWDGPYDLLVTGVGGTGVVTVGAVVAMAAHLEGKRASVLDFMGFAQKGGAVLSFVRLADRPERLHQVRIDTQQADALLACDLVVGASPEALQTVRHGRTRILANLHETPVAGSMRDPQADLHAAALLEKMRFVAGAAQVETFEAQALAETFLGDTITANILALGYAWQRALVPVGLPALLRAIELNGVAVADNLRAFGLGRLAAADPAALQALQGGPAGLAGGERAAARAPDAPQGPQALEAVEAVAGPAAPEAPEGLDALITRACSELRAYQNEAWAQRFLHTVDKVRQAEAALQPQAEPRLTPAVARSLLKLMTCKDEYEVARLYTDGRFQRRLAEQFEGDLKLTFHMAPAWLPGRSGRAGPRKVALGGWLLPVMRVLAWGRRLRGGWMDPFGYQAERRLERALIPQFEARVDELLAQLEADNLPLAVQIAALPLGIRGFGHVKQAQLAQVRLREAELLHRLAPQVYPRPDPGTAGTPQAGQIRGIAVVAAPR